MLELKDLWVGPTGQGREQALLKGIGLAVDQGQVLGLVGASGAGKTLTALSLSGLLPPELEVLAGSLSIDGQPVALGDAAPWPTLRGRSVLLLFQGARAALDPTMRVRTQISEALGPVRGLGRGQARRTAGLALERFGLGSDMHRAYPHQLSGGMRQRVMLALAWALRPQVLIADEPGSGLDSAAQQGMLAMFQELVGELGAAMLLITHDLRAAVRLASHLVVMERGRVVDQGPAEALLARPGHGFTRALADSLVFLEGADA